MFKRFLNTQSLKDPSGDAERMRTRLPSRPLTQGRVLRNMMRKNRLQQ